jgi:hypothetical protein
MEIVGSPVDRRVDGSEPGFAEDEIVVLERVEEGIQVIGVLVTGNRDGAGVGRD